MPTVNDNPLSLVYSEMFRMAKEEPVLQDWVKDRNMLSLDREQNMKDSTTAADYPELILICPSFEGQVIASSSTTQLLVTYNWLLTSGSLLIPNVLMQVQWGMVLAMHQWQRNLCQLKWKDQQFVKTVNFGTIENSLEDTEQNRGTFGWTSTWPITVEMFIPLKWLRRK